MEMLDEQKYTTSIRFLQNRSRLPADPRQAAKAGPAQINVMWYAQAEGQSHYAGSQSMKIIIMG